MPILVHYYFSAISTIEDSQQLLFPIVAVLLFFLMTSKGIKFPNVIFIFSLVVWILLLLRVDIMDSREFFTGRVVVGRLSDDPDGLEGRRLFKSLQKIALTYHLPGPSLLPVLGTNSIHGNDKNTILGQGLRRLKIKKSVPALEIYGSSQWYTLVPNQVKHYGTLSCGEVSDISICEDRIDVERVRFAESPLTSKFMFAIPSYPSTIQIRTKPGYTIEHYIEWLSAYFSPEINNKVEVRFDVLFEAATLEGLEVQGIERVFVKLLLSFEELNYFLADGSSYHLRSARERLNELLYLVKTIKSPELHGFAYNLYALTLIYGSEMQEFEIAKKTLAYTAQSNDISLFQRKIAAYNLGLIEAL